MGDLLPENATAVAAEASIPSPHGTAMRLARSFAIYGIANFGIRGLSFLLVWSIRIICVHLIMESFTWRRSLLRPDDFR